jgi:hypothetical protein
MVVDVDLGIVVLVTVVVGVDGKEPGGSVTVVGVGGTVVGTGLMGATVDVVVVVGSGPVAGDTNLAWGPLGPACPLTLLPRPDRAGARRPGDPATRRPGDPAGFSSSTHMFGRPDRDPTPARRWALW